MGSKTGIEWTDSTWNPLRGCSRVSEGCRNCYAETMAARFSGPGQPHAGLAVMRNGKPSWTGKVELVEKHLLNPLKWKPGQPIYDATTGKRVGNDASRPRRIFVNSMSDLFHEDVTDEMRDRIFAVMGLCPQHVFQVLTKRPERMLAYFAKPNGFRFTWREGYIQNAGYAIKPEGHFALSVWPLPNVWLGVSVENQAAADERIPLLLQTPAAVRFISAEPLLGLVNLFWPNHYLSLNRRVVFGQLGKERIYDGLDWVICGGESGPGARPMQEDWVRSLLNRCQGTNVPFFFKQWGEWLPAMCDGATDRTGAQVLNASDQPQRVGKKAAGALLDGREWKQFPVEGV
jgi:protein gp37